MARKIKLLVITTTDDGMHSNGPSHIVYVQPGVSASDAYVEWKLANLSDYEKKQEWASKLHLGMTDEEWWKISFSMDVCMDDSKIWEVEIPGEAGDGKPSGKEDDADGPK